MFLLVLMYFKALKCQAKPMGNERKLVNPTMNNDAYLLND